MQVDGPILGINLNYVAEQLIPICCLGPWVQTSLILGEQTDEYKLKALQYLRDNVAIKPAYASHEKHCNLFANRLTVSRAVPSEPVEVVDEQYEGY